MNYRIDLVLQKMATVEAAVKNLREALDEYALLMPIPAHKWPNDPTKTYLVEATQYGHPVHDIMQWDEEKERLCSTITLTELDPHSEHDY
ncbi:hypothetical protein, partial [Actinomyces sp. HMSC065F12]|uniref:hypothetical protein n=1 Tax=Actinomyces sp. HMSC065F12 TaxID=1739479 RepID=UPI00114D27D1